jgi:hypothetical protein
MQVEIVLRGAQDRLGAQAQVPSDTVHGVDDKVADPQLGERNGNAFFDRPDLDAFCRRAEHFAIAEHTQTQMRQPKPRLDTSLIHPEAA